MEHGHQQVSEDELHRQPISRTTWGKCRLSVKGLVVTQREGGRDMIEGAFTMLEQGSTGTDLLFQNKGALGHISLNHKQCGDTKYSRFRVYYD